MIFTVYSKPNCTYCDQAKALLEQNGYEYDEVIVDVGQEKQEGKRYITVAELKLHIPTAKTVPQIFMDHKLIGGFSELKKVLSEQK